MADTSALQLGAQAIQMFHDSLRKKSEESRAAAENARLKNEAGKLQARVGDLEAAVAEKRGEVKEMSDTLAQRMCVMYELENEVEAAGREKRQAAQEAAAQLSLLQVHYYDYDFD